jgi:hypothetical protein
MLREKRQWKEKTLSEQAVNELLTNKVKIIYIDKSIADYNYFVNFLLKKEGGVGEWNTNDTN